MTVLLWLLVMLALFVSFVSLLCAISALFHCRKISNFVDGLASVINAHYESNNNRITRIERKINFRVIK